MSLQIWFSIIPWLAMVIQPSLEVVLNKKKGDVHLPIECSLNGDISFKFTSKLSNKTHTIAACSTNINSCYFSDKILQQRYAISKSDVGGVLFIIDVSENSFGRYTCYETYNATNSAAVDVDADDLGTSRRSAPCTIVEGSSSSSIGLILAVVQTLLLVACIVYFIFRVNSKACCTNRKDSEDEETGKDSSTIDIEDVTLKDDTAITLQYDDIQLDSRSIPLAAIPPVQSTYKTNETHILTQSKSVPFAAEPLLRHTSTSTKSTMNTPSISLSPRLTHSRAGVPSRYQNYRFKV